MKEIKDFLPYYLGQACTIIRNDGKTIEDMVCLSLMQEIWIPGKHAYQYRTVKPHLRRLSDMTEQEAEEGNLWSEWHDNVLCMQGWEQKGYLPDQFHYLLKQGFDLFGLIDEGLAVDAKTITT